MKKSTTAILVVIMLLLGAIVAYAVVEWQGTINWTLENKQFTVWHSPTGGLEIATPWSDPLGIVQNGQQIIYDFHLQNEGTVAITIQAIQTTSTGATVLWSNDGSWTVAIGLTRVLATLTLTVTGTGNYDWKFAIVA